MAASGATGGEARQVAGLIALTAALRIALDALIGPSVDEVAAPLPVADWPTDTTCNAFDADAIVRSW